ncbi:Transposable element Hobo transposase [Frankliniella fusca]|uniref:Transposable element Hobo transposase n=1 Tax=Frankliniella fusca TaxID=407009 RepID=A0AAE1I329_9NEOP|nr:Transposable element Hobo transposase [Frankliniella fusca]
MPGRNTVMSRIESRAAEATAEIVPRVRAAIRDGRCQGATDMWTDDQSKNHFNAITVSFTNEAGDASETHDLATSKFPSNIRATGANIRAAMTDAMQGIGIPPDEFNLMEWVTDRGANVRKALVDLSREDCTAHVINTVVRSALSVPYYEVRQKAFDALSPAALEVINTAEAAVKAVKGAPQRLVVKGVLLDALQKALVVPQAQWRSKYSSMLTSLCVGKTKVLSVLEALGQQDLHAKVRDMDEDIVKKNKTIAAGDLASVKQHLSVHPDDTQDIKHIKEALSDLHLLIDVLVLIKEAKEVVQYLKSSGLASNLSKKVMQEVETRWNSIHTMLASVLDSYDEIAGVLELHGEGTARHRMQKIDRDMLKWLTEFLEIFKTETKTLEGNNHPTLPCVVLASVSLRDNCEPELLDSPHLSALKRRCSFFLGEKFNPSIKAKVATFLWPDYKEMPMLSEDERDQVKAKVRSLMVEAAEAGGKVGGVDDPADQNPIDAPPDPKVPRLDRYAKYRVRPAADPKDEVDKYLATSVPSVPLHQLQQHCKMLDRPEGLPRLARVALRELGKLATAAPSERV